MSIDVAEAAPPPEGPLCQVFAWGVASNNQHALPIRDGSPKTVPTNADLFEEAGLNTAAQLKISLGGSTGLAVTATGQAFSWGSTTMRGQAADIGNDKLPRLLIKYTRTIDPLPPIRLGKRGNPKPQDWQRYWSARCADIITLA